MKRIMVLAIVAFLTMVAPVTAEMIGGTGELYVPNTNGQETVVPMIVDNFVTGTTQFGQNAYPNLETLKNKCSQGNATCVLQGTVSDLHISQNGCYVDPGNRAYFSLHQGPKHLAANNAAETDRICNAELATARAWTVRDWLVQQGVPKNRIIIYDFPVEAKRGNSPLVNQSVAALVIYNSGNTGNCPGKNCPVPKLEVIKPANCEYTESQNTVNDTLVIKIVMTCDPVASTETRTQSTVDPEEEQTCPWYNQYPCWTKGQKGLFWGAVGVGTAAAILGTTCIDLGGGQGGKNGGGDGGGIRIGNCK